MQWLINFLVKKMLNGSENDSNQFIQTLFQISPASFHGKWQKLFKYYEKFSFHILRYIQMTARTTNLAIELEMIKYMTLANSWILLEFLFSPSIFETDLVSELVSKLEPNSSSFSIQQILFYLDSWVFRYGLKKKGPMSLILPILFSLLDKNPKYIHQVHNHPALLSLFLPSHSDMLDSDSFKGSY